MAVPMGKSHAMRVGRFVVGAGRAEGGVMKAADVAYLDGLLSAFDDLPDGAWQAACEDAISRDRRFAKRDAFDVWLAWCEAKAATGGKDAER